MKFNTDLNKKEFIKAFKNITENMMIIGILLIFSVASYHCYKVDFKKPHDHIDVKIIEKNSNLTEF